MSLSDVCCALSTTPRMASNAKLNPNPTAPATNVYIAIASILMIIINGYLYISFCIFEDDLYKIENNLGYLHKIILLN